MKCYTRLFLATAVVGSCVGCAADEAEQAPDSYDTIASASQSLTSLTLRGKVTTASGVALPGIKVSLSGKKASETTTDAGGNYTFSGLAAGSYSLRPSKASCGFSPDVVNLNNITSSRTQNFVGSGSGCGATTKALMLVDERLYSLLKTELDQYRSAASARRGFGIDLRVMSHLDDMPAPAVRNYVIQARTENPALEGVLYIGNVHLPSFYKNRADLTDTRLYPAYFEDLDATFTQEQPPGSIDPLCDGTNDLHCAVGGPLTVPPHDFDAIKPGASPATELWAAFLPVGVAGTVNGYGDFADQLRPFLSKVSAYYSGQHVPNGRLYYVGNDIGERFEWSWDAFGNQKIDFYGKPGPNGETDAACIANGQNLCYTRWPVESFATAAAFRSYYETFPWVAEQWQRSDILIPHMNQSLYSVVQINTHALEEWSSIISNVEAKALTNAGLIVELNGCLVAGFAQPYSSSYVNTEVSPSNNLALSFLYGSSKTIAVMGEPFSRVHYANYPLIHREMKVNRAYLGLAHRTRMAENYAAAGNSTLALKDHAIEMLLGDPFMDLN